jgi:hypothetical protein
MRESQQLLSQIEQDFGQTTNYLNGQWQRQRQMQLSAMENNTQKEIQKQVEELVLLEGKLREAQ